MEKKNTMGNDVQEGYKCKPINKDPNRPIMHLKTQIFICEGDRCQQAGDKNLANELRELLEDMGLNVGHNRIKITRTSCFGACRYRQVAEIFENTQRNGNVSNNCLWLKNIHQFDKDKWIEIFKRLSNNEPIADVCELIEMENI